MFSISRFHSENMTDQEVRNKAEENADNDRIGTILYVKENFEQEVLNGEFKDSIRLYTIAEDERGVLFEESLEQEISDLFLKAKIADGDKNQLSVMLSDVGNNLPIKLVQKISSGDKIVLNSEQKSIKERIGFSFAIISLGFIFGGVFIAYTVIEERNNKVYTRITLSKTSRYEYMISKLTVSVLVSTLQTVIIWLGLTIFIRPDFGISRMSYVFLVFLLGLVFNTLSLSVGVVIGNAMEANYAVFSIWCLTSLLSGLYFSIDNASGLFRKLSNLMPQKWYLRGAEMLMTGDNSAYLMTISVTAAFLIVFISIGAASLKLKLEE
jgi:ABC-type multidrug transport system permease subunit